MVTQSGFSVFDETLSPLIEGLPSELMRKFVDTPLSEKSMSRLEVLREKANDGTLSEAERQEYEEFVIAMDVVASLKLKAQKALLRSGSA